MIFDSAEDLNARTIQSFVTIQNTLYYVMHTDRKTIHGYNPNKDEVDKLDFVIGKTDIQPPPLGYIDAPGYGPIYVSRAPQRAWKIGLTRTNCMNRFLFDNFNMESLGVMLNQILQNKYRKPRSILENINKGGDVGGAVSRKYALRKDGFFWCGSKLGKLNMISNILVLPSRKEMVFHVSNLSELDIPFRMSFEENISIRDYKNDYDV